MAVDLYARCKSEGDHDEDPFVPFLRGQGNVGEP